MLEELKELKNKILGGLFIAVFAAALTGCQISIKVPPTEYELTAIASTDKVNAYGYQVITSAFLNDAYLVNTKQKIVPLLINHDASTHSVLGRVDSLELQFGKVVFTATIVDTVANRELIRKIQNKEITAVSIGFKPTKMKGKIIYGVELLEISVVPIPADKGARIISIEEK